MTSACVVGATQRGDAVVPCSSRSAAPGGSIKRFALPIVLNDGIRVTKALALAG